MLSSRSLLSFVDKPVVGKSGEITAVSDLFSGSF